MNKWARETGNPYSEAEVIESYALQPGDLDSAKGERDGE